MTHHWPTWRLRDLHGFFSRFESSNNQGESSLSLDAFGPRPKSHSFFTFSENDIVIRVN